MSKEANAGELRTPVYFMRLEKRTDEDGVPINWEVNIFGEGAPLRCKWVNGHGTEVFAAMQMNIQEPATITCRYSPLITKNQIVSKMGDPKPYATISLDNVEEKNKWLEIKVKRRSQAR